MSDAPKPDPAAPLRFAAVQKWKTDGGESVIEYFETREECLRWIALQRRSPDWTWCVGEFA